MVRDSEESGTYRRKLISFLAAEALEYTDVANDIEIHNYPDSGQVTLTCGAEAFARIWAVVVAEVGPFDGAPQAVRIVLIERRPSPRPPTPWRDRLALLGCGMMGFVLLFVLVVGVRSIANWVQ